VGIETSAPDEFDDIEPGQARVLLQPGLYPAQYVSRSFRRFNGWGEKLIVQWKVFLSANKQHHVTLSRYYNVQRNKALRLVIGDGHCYRKDWIAANNGRVSIERTRLPFSVFEDKMMVVAVLTVTKDSQRSIPAFSQWSKIGWIERPLGESESLERLPLEPLDS